MTANSTVIVAARVPCRDLPNTALLPHIGSATASTRDAMARVCAENVISVIEGRDPTAAVV